MALTLPELPYDYDGLGEYMSAETLEYHHDKHHKAYIDKGNEKSKQDLNNDNFIPAMLDAFKNDQGLFNQLGQHYNHLHFWQWMAPNGGGKNLPGELEKHIESDLGGFDGFRKKFIEGGTGQFGSGWVWLAMDKNGKFEVMSTKDGENPICYGKTPLLGCDVWEHSYYIDYRNARQKYLEAFVDHLINWEHVAELYGEGQLKEVA
ncbi:MAG: superoxide dismutase [Micavibrio sp.]|nr:superoxide dismutase [Micavibrio sp.]|tara:strand:+ start:283 stop:897 length:615 start_codon:yes stop_codon:yes gene_type:complete